MIVIKFTKDELLALRKPNSKVLDSMAEMSPEIVSEKALDPACWEPFDQDEVIRLFNASAQQGRRQNVPEGLGPKKNRQRGKRKKLAQMLCRSITDSNSKFTFHPCYRRRRRRQPVVPWEQKCRKVNVGRCLWFCWRCWRRL